MSAPDGKGVATLRKRLGLSQQEVADATGICRSSISKIESGNAIDLTLRQAMALAASFGLSVDQLFGLEVPASALAIAREIVEAKTRLDVRLRLDATLSAGDA